MAHFAFRRLESLLVVVQDAQTPADSEWSVYLEVCREMSKAPGGIGAASALIFTDGGVPNSTQRVALTQILQGKAAISAVVSDSLLIRASLGVFAMINTGLQVFPSRDWKKAAAFARIAEDRHLEILKVAVALGRDVGDPKVLRAIGL